MIDATLCIPIKGDPVEEVLLGYKKKGFGKGKFGGFGGKLEAGETIVLATIRELEEESGLIVSENHLSNRGVLFFSFPAQPDWDQVVHIFLIKTWKGNPIESMEMTPFWFRINEIPYATMWDDSSYWLPLIVQGKRIQAKFSFKHDCQTVDNVEIILLDNSLSVGLE